MSEKTNENNTGIVLTIPGDKYFKLHCKVYDLHYKIDLIETKMRSFKCSKLYIYHSKISSLITYSMAWGGINLVRRLLDLSTNPIDFYLKKDGIIVSNKDVVKIPEQTLLDFIENIKDLQIFLHWILRKLYEFIDPAFSALCHDPKEAEDYIATIAELMNSSTEIVGLIDHIKQYTTKGRSKQGN